MALVLIGSFMLAEVIGGLVANSLALLADAGHMVTDFAAIGLALLAMWVAARPASARRTFGFHRVEVLAALLNGLSLWLIAAWIFFEAYRRFLEPPEVRGLLVLTVGFAGLAVNVAAAWVLRRSAAHSLNVEGAFLHVIGDLLGSIGVVASGILILAFGWYVADPILGVAIGLLILLTSTRMLWKVFHVLMEGTPATVDLQTLCSRLEGVEGVAGVHDIHAWTITSGYDVLSAHVTVEPGVSAERVLPELVQVARGAGISHATFQVEREAEECEEAHHVSHDDAEEVGRGRR